jgi:sporulation protein YlmC with PRC-barrel domain
MNRTILGVCGWMGMGVAALALAADPPPRVKVEVRKAPEVAPPANARPGAEAEADNANTVRSSELMGTEIVLQDGDSLGQVADLIINSGSGQVTHVVVETEQQFRAIPYRTLSMFQGEEAKDRYFILGMERDRFLEAPAIPHEQWQTFSAPQWRTYAPSVTKFYTNVEPVAPGPVRRADRAIDRNIRQGERKAERKLD